MMRIAIVAFIMLLVVLVVAHEFGHFILAKKAGVKVYEFAIGMWPKLFSFNKPKIPADKKDLTGEEREKMLEQLREENKKTELSFRALPLWGFVSIKGETPAEGSSSNDKNSLVQAPFWRKIAILLWWVTMNMIVARILFTVWFTKWVYPIQIVPDNMLWIQSRSYIMPSQSFLEEKWFISGELIEQPALIESVLANEIASDVWLQEWDTILSINGVSVSNINIQTELKNHIGGPLEIEFSRDWVVATTGAVCPSDSCFLGVTFNTINTTYVEKIKFPFVKAMWVAAGEVVEQTRLTFASLGMLFKSIGAWEDVSNKVTWPVWAARIGQMILESGGFMMFLMFGGMFSMALAIFNLLPIPALDWGRILWFVIQRIFKVKSERYYLIENWINGIFFILLMWLWVWLIFHDLIKIWWVKIPFIW